MAQKRDPRRDKAWELYKKKKGNISPKEIGEKLGVEAKTIRQWKCRDKWEEQLKTKRKRGGQPGNKNAKGNSGGAPFGNTNAETHGAYSTPRIENWTQEERDQLFEAVGGAGFGELAKRQLEALAAKQIDLERRIAELDGDEPETLYLDRIMTMTMPDGGEMKYRSESSTFQRKMTLEGELNRVQGRIQKLLDSIRAREDTTQRMDFDREKFSFAKQKAIGQYTVGDDGHILTEEEPDDSETITE